MKKLRFILLSTLIGVTAGIALAQIPQSSALSFSGIEMREFGDAEEETVWETNEQTLYCEEEATHYHTYTNTTGPDEDYWFYARATKFRIYLHDDFMEYVDTSSLECSSGGSWISCDGGSSSADGGTTISFVEGDTSSYALYENYIEWNYGVTTSSDSPVIPGYNDYDDDGVIDTEDESYRTMGEYLTFDFFDDIASGSATTTSSIYIKFWS